MPDLAPAPAPTAAGSIDGPAPSYLLRAVLEPETGVIQSASKELQRLAHLGDRLQAGEAVRLLELFEELDAAAWEQLYRRHLLPSILQQFYGVAVTGDRLQAEPTVATLRPLQAGAEPHYILFWLRFDDVVLERRDRHLDELAGVDVAALLRDNPPSQRLWDERLAWENYRVSGRLLWEGCDITGREMVQRLIQALSDPDPSLASQRFAVVAAPLRKLFRADSLAIFEPRSRQWQILAPEASPETLTLPEVAVWADSLAGQAAAAGRVWNIRDLQQESLTSVEQDFLARGWRSLLLLPIHRTGTAELLGLVALASAQPQHFDQLDAERAIALLPGWRAALRQANRQAFSRVHPSVAWRFQEEAERRSLGLPAAPIVFENVYPMYGISDLRGSAQERNRAIQTDLIAQFELALATVEVALEEQPNAFLQQLRLDLLAYIERLQGEIQVEDEVTAVQYLRQHFEIYLDYFRQRPAAAAAAETYWQAVDNDQHCIYQAREDYDTTLQAIASQLRATWERWQQTMQAILPHYCDLEVSDGIDHMLYVGAAIDTRFSHFHLHSLRYEQLRALCDCARTCLDLSDTAGNPVQVSHLVLVQDVTVDIFHDEQTERVFDVRGTRDTRYEIVKKRIDKGIDTQTRERITQPGMLTIVYSTEAEWREYHQYLRYLLREGWIEKHIESGTVESLPGAKGLRYARVAVRVAAEEA